MKIVVDRIEGSMAVLEIGEHTVDFPVSALPEGVAEGSTLRVVLDEDDGTLDEARERLERLKKRDPGGDVFDL